MRPSAVSQSDFDELERIIDRFGLGVVIDSLGDICNGKADHLESNWQDRGAAKEWTKAARLLEKVSVNMERLRLG